MISRHAIKDDESNEAYLTMFRGEKMMRIPKIRWDAVEDRIRATHQMICRSIPQMEEDEQLQVPGAIPIMVISAFEPVDPVDDDMLENYQDTWHIHRGSNGAHNNRQGDPQSSQSPGDPIGKGISNSPPFSGIDIDNDEEESEPPDLTREDSDSDSDDDTPFRSGDRE